MLPLPPCPQLRLPLSREEVRIAKKQSTPLLLPRSSLWPVSIVFWFCYYTGKPFPSPAGARNVLRNLSRKGYALTAWAIATQHVCMLEPLKRFTRSDWFPLVASCMFFICQSYRTHSNKLFNKALEGERETKFKKKYYPGAELGNDCTAKALLSN